MSDALPVSLLGMNAKEMGQYIRFCADRLLVALGVPKATWQGVQRGQPL